MALLFTIVLMFSLKGELMVGIPALAWLVKVVPLVPCFALMFVIRFVLGKAMGADYPQNAAISLNDKAIRYSV